MSEVQGTPSTLGVPGQALEVDESDADARSEVDSALGDADRLSATTSITSSITQYREEHGRRYHAFDDSQYWLPNDDTEIERLDIQHLVWRLTLDGKLYLAPIPDDVQDVIDIGTGKSSRARPVSLIDKADASSGAGQWAIEFADAHPSAHVLGTDLSPIQPSWVPSNCEFLVANAEDDWNLDKQYDFVHSRMLIFGIHDWAKYFRQTWETLKPGGWMEVLEPEFPIAYADDGSVTSESPLLMHTNLVREACAIDGIDSTVTRRFGEMLRAQGFVNVKEEVTSWPIGTWPKGAREKQVSRCSLLS